MSSTPDQERPDLRRVIELAKVTGASETLQIADIDSVMVREWSSQWLFDVVLKSGETVTVPASDQNLAYLLEALGFLVEPADIPPSDIGLSSQDIPSPPAPSK